MPSPREVEQELAFTANLNNLVTAYEEIAVMRIEQLRTTVLAARRFRQGLSRVYSEVRTAHHRQVTTIEHRQQQTKSHQEAAVLLSTNTRLAGALVSHVAEYFARHADRNADLIVVGAAGKEQLAGLISDSQLTVFPLPNHQPTPEDLAPLIRKLLEYHSTTFYYGHFRNLVQQEPTSVTLGELAGGEEEKPPAKSLLNTRKTPFISEPDLATIIDFFNQEIFALLVQQTANESWLSLLGSRITAMEQAAAQIQAELANLTLQQQQLKRDVRNRKQRDRLAGLSLWQTT